MSCEVFTLHRWDYLNVISYFLADSSEIMQFFLNCSYFLTLSETLNSLTNTFNFKPVICNCVVLFFSQNPRRHGRRCPHAGDAFYMCLRQAPDVGAMTDVPGVPRPRPSKPSGRLGGPPRHKGPMLKICCKVKLKMKVLLLQLFAA